MRTTELLPSGCPGNRRLCAGHPNLGIMTKFSAWFSAGSPQTRVQEMGGRCYNKTSSDGRGVGIQDPVRREFQSSEFGRKKCPRFAHLGSAKCGAAHASSGVQSCARSPGPRRLVRTAAPRSRSPQRGVDGSPPPSQEHVFLKNPVRRAQSRTPNFTPQQPRAAAGPPSPGEPQAGEVLAPDRKLGNG